ncbi:SRPBCC family protein [uncultured Phycicoccus sp.]|uniref:SRPBCC family protein n=1 Tax=uncultured Phycicoccus sp. TaxID=661422 RepID=UPI002638F44F|nr:SRPBCC family protein [uncultured Phycicoccus sp.]
MLGDRWGVTDAEVARRYTCDGVVPEPVLEAWRGVTVAAAPAQVWPWVCQIRVAPYSYDWIDNLGQRSPRRLLGLDAPRVGEAFTRTGGRPVGQVLAVDEGRELTGRIMGAVMSYLLVPNGATSTRLLLKVVLARGRLLAPFVAVGDLVMARRQLLTFAELAEADPTGP